MKTPTSQNTKVRNLSKKREQLKTPSPRRPNRSRKHHLPANLTREDQWESGEAPQVKTSRMFVGMLALHLVAVGGLVAFHFFGHEPADQLATATSPAPQAVAPASTPAKPASQTTPNVARPTPSVPNAEKRTPPPAIPAGFVEHMVRIDETWESIAQTRGVNAEDLRTANPGIDFNVGRLILIPPAPRLISAGQDPATKRIEAGKGTPVTFAGNEANQGSSFHRYALNPDTLPPAVDAPAERNSNRSSTPTRPKSTPTGSTVKVNANAPVSSGKFHVVSKGETIFGISKQRGVSDKAIMKLNGITDPGKIREGQKLKMPTSN